MFSLSQLAPPVTSRPVPNDGRLGVLVREAAASLAGSAPQTVLEWALRTFPRDRIALCTSLQREGMVLLDMATRLDPLVQVVTIDTGRLPIETHEFIDCVRARYAIRIEVLHPNADELSQLTAEHGVNPFYRSVELRLLCCRIRKINPLTPRLQRLDAWITGLRRSGSAERAAVNQVELDTVHGGIVKLNPLAHWTTEQVEAYTKAHNVPVHPLYAKGYTSIGCAPCTRPVMPGEDPRAGRWWWERGAKECGIHSTLTVDASGAVRSKAERGHVALEK